MFVVLLYVPDYNSPIVLVKKKGGTNRFCVDFRRINLVTMFDTEPMGNPEDIMSKLKVVQDPCQKITECF